LRDPGRQVVKLTPNAPEQGGPLLQSVEGRCYANAALTTQSPSPSSRPGLWQQRKWR